MNITRNNIDELNAVINIKVEATDYEKRVKKVLTEHRKKSEIKGFRKGAVPFNLMKKMYGKAVLAEEVHQIINEELRKYFTEEKLNVLGEPMPNDSQDIDFEHQTEFNFAFDVAIAPEFDVQLSKDKKYPYYSVIVDAEMIDGQIESYKQRYGIQEKTEIVKTNDAVLKGDLCQLNADGKSFEGGIVKDDTMLSLYAIKDDEIKKSFIDASIHQVINLNLKNAFPNTTEISSMLYVSKEIAETLDGDFQFVIKEITEFRAAEVNQELFNKVYGEGKVNSLDEFKENIKEEIQKGLEQQSNYRFGIDVKDELKKELNLSLPSKFLKKWLRHVNEDNEGLTDEQFEKEFPLFEEDLRWQLIRDKITFDNKLEVKEEEVKILAKNQLMMQFQQYGMPLSEEQMESYVKEMLSKDEEKRKYYDQVRDNKVIELVKNSVSLEEKEITSQDFQNLFKV